MRSLKTFLPPLAVMLLSMGICSGTVYALDRCEIPHGATYNIDEHSTCRAVTNNHASGQTIMVPTKSAAEWSSGANAFLNALPTGVTAAACSSCGTITNCAASGGGGGGVVAGAQTFSTAGSFNFTIPCFNTLTVEVWGGGGGGAGCNTSSGAVGVSGGSSSWDGSVIANGGIRASTSAGGAGGSATGGTTNLTGQNGSTSSSAGAKGGNGANGGAGGAQVSAGNNGKPGSAPGGGGGGAFRGGGPMSTGERCYGDGGGGGGYSSRTYASGTFAAGAEIPVIVGSGGAGGNGNAYDGGLGAVGRVTITWD